MISMPLPAVSAADYHITACGTAYEIRHGSVVVARVAIAEADPTAQSVLLRGVELADESRIDEAADGLRILCDAIWKSTEACRIVLLCSATSGHTRKTMAAMGAALEGVQRSVPAPGSGVPEDQAQFSILRGESHRPEKRSAAGEIRLRPAGKDDLDALYDLERSAFGVGYDLGQLRQFLDLFTGLIILAEDGDGWSLGYLLQAPTYPDPSTAWILSMGVRREAQTRGVGTALMKAGLSLLRSIDVHTVLLTVDPNNSQARRLYERAGFRDQASTPNYFGLHEDRLTMVLEDLQRVTD